MYTVCKIQRNGSVQFNVKNLFKHKFLTYQKVQEHQFLQIKLVKKINISLYFTEKCF